VRQKLDGKLACQVRFNELLYAENLAVIVHLPRRENSVRQLCVTSHLDEHHLRRQGRRLSPAIEFNEIEDQVDE